MDRKIGDLQVWWVPQVPMKAFYVDVRSIEEAATVLDALARYDLFQLENNVKPDFSNTGGLRVWCAYSDGAGSPGWEDWCDEESGEADPVVYLAEMQQ